MALQVKKMGWIRDLPDHRDHQFAAPLAQLKVLPKSVDLRPAFHALPYDQGRIGSCTANAIAGAIQFAREKAKMSPDFTPSRLFIYFNERKAEHTVPLDAGAMIRTGIKSVNKMGACTEATWPYDDTPANEETSLFPAGSKAITTPSKEAYAEGDRNKIVSYSRVLQSLVPMKACLAQGFPFTVGFSVFDSLYDPHTGHPLTTVPLPGAGDSLLGGHAVLAVGYDDASHLFTLRNSWGPKAQHHGYFYMPYAYLTNAELADDFWTIRVVASS